MKGKSILKTLLLASEDISIEHIKRIAVEWEGTADNICKTIHGGYLNVLIINIIWADDFIYTCVRMYTHTHA